MSRRDKKLSPGPSSRGDLMTEKDQGDLRHTIRRASSGGKMDEEEEMAAADQAEGERSGVPATKVAHTPDQAEGERESIEEEIRHDQERRNL